MAEAEYIMPAEMAEFEYTDRRSVFIGRVCPVQTEEQALQFVKDMKKKYGDARHNVWAYTLQNGGMRSSDDGEPSGTAGAPVLDAMVKRGITNCVTVVTRYFGGILLGTGGLVHAYSAASSGALEKAGRVRVVSYHRYLLNAGYDQYGTVLRLLEKAGAQDLQSDFSEKVRISFLIFPENYPSFEKELTERSSGGLKAELIGKEPVKLQIL